MNRVSNGGLFGFGANSDARYIANHKKLAQMADACRALGLKIVLTMGTFDLIHIGHFLYLERAKSYADLLIVGVDSDKKVKQRKGPDRPVVSEDERVQMLTHVRHVDIVTLKPHNAPKWELIKIIKPDVLIATKETYTKEELKQLKKWCKEVVVLEPQATTSTTAKLRRLNINMANKVKTVVNEAIQKAFDEIQKNA